MRAARKEDDIPINPFTAGACKCFLYPACNWRLGGQALLLPTCAHRHRCARLRFSRTAAAGAAPQADLLCPAVLPPAGVYIATMMATVQTLQEKGHPYSEICNEVGAGFL